MKREAWYELTGTIPLEGPSWVAARAFGNAADGSPDAEAHTNPVYVHLDGKAPYDRGSLDDLVGKLDGQMAKHPRPDVPREGEGARPLPGVARPPPEGPRGRRAAGRRACRPTGSREVDQARFDPSARDAHRRRAGRVPQARPAQDADRGGSRRSRSAGGFRLEPVAAEPLVHSPVAAAFDEDGNLTSPR